MSKHKKLTSTERGLLANWVNQGLSNSECARRLGRHASTIGRELKRNQVRVKIGKDWKYIYEPLLMPKEFLRNGNKTLGWQNNL